MLFTQNSFHFLKHIVHFYSTCAYSRMLRMVLAFDELLLTVSTEILFQWTNIVAWQQMPTFWGNSSKSTRDPGWFVGFFVFFPFWISRDARRVGKLWITPSGSSSEVSHSISVSCLFVFNMILVNVEEREEKRGSVHFF